MNGRERIALICLVLLCASISTFTVNHFDVYGKTPYEIEVIQSHLKLATTTQNIDDKVGYINDTVESLTAYSGNSNWWFPNETTDIDQTRNVLASVARDIQAQDDVKDRDGYFTLPHNELVIYLDSQIKKTDNRLDYYASAWYYDPANNLGIWILPFVSVFFLTFTILFLCLGDEYNYRRDWNNKQEEKERQKRIKELE